jgi:hypothetical protein
LVQSRRTQQITQQGFGFEQDQAGIAAVDFPALPGFRVFSVRTANDGDPGGIAVEIRWAGRARRQL